MKGCITRRFDSFGSSFIWIWNETSEHRELIFIELELHKFVGHLMDTISSNAFASRQHDRIV
jgi:hypothetical protein